MISPTKNTALVSLLAEVVDPIGPHPVVYHRAPGTKDGTGTPLRPAAVLFPLTYRNNQLQAILTVRNQSLRNHPGQISFPGGKADQADSDVAATAMREAFEELGILQQDVAVIGALETCTTGTGFSIVPVLGIIPPHDPYRIDRAEVEEVFHVPLDYLMDDARHQRLRRLFNGSPQEYFAIDYEKYHIWGATARMIVGLHGRLGGKHATPRFKKLFSICDNA